ncbi:PrgI family protein [Brevibacillus humidisoli]|uniref:PrgI family mobile element protein n=1 Tax=Brevibacillus humidisoli TaxID=2895522 RepID=UPI001E4504B7|nr:PrgI family protein [Brevibacillus humidisoli]UFJ41350.1 PrgI family protein [Brevibacillus humidisoli]
MYLIPKNVNTRFEFRDGVGWKEIVVMLAGVGVGLILFFLLGLFSTGLFIRLILLAAPIIGAFFLIQPHPMTKQSVLDTLWMAHRFRRSKKRYLYKFGGDRV